MPAGMAIEVAEGTSLQEPELFHFPSLLRSGPPPNEPTDHSLPLRRIDGIAVGVPEGTVLSEASAIAASEGALKYFFAEQYLLELTFRAEREEVFDLRPELPLVIRALA